MAKVAITHREKKICKIYIGSNFSLVDWDKIFIKSHTHTLMKLILLQGTG